MILQHAEVEIDRNALRDLRRFHAEFLRQGRLLFKHFPQFVRHRHIDGSLAVVVRHELQVDPRKVFDLLIQILLG